MEFIEVSAKTVEDALTDASVQLGITSDQLEYEIVEKGSSGFLGIGSKNAVIRVKVKSSIEDEVNAQRAKFAQQTINTALNEQGTNPRATHHVASMKARDAYGIGTRSALRRPR